MLQMVLAKALDPIIQLRSLNLIGGALQDSQDTLAAQMRSSGGCARDEER